MKPSLALVTRSLALVTRSLAQCLASECPLQSSHVFPSRDQVRAHLWEHVKTRMAPFLEGKSGDSLPADCPVRSGLKLGLTVLFMAEAVDFVVPKNDLDALCFLLTPSAGSAEALHSDLSPILSKPQKYFPFISSLFSILCVRVFYMHICLCTMCMPGACGGQKVLQTGVSQHVDTGHNLGSPGVAVLSTTEHLSSLRTISVLCLFAL